MSGLEIFSTLSFILITVGIILIGLFVATRGFTKKVIISLGFLIAAMLLTTFAEKISIFISPYVNEVFGNYTFSWYYYSLYVTTIAVYYYLFSTRKTTH